MTGLGERGAIGFVVAMPVEAKPLVKALSLRGAGANRWEGALDGRPIVAVVTGMGTELAMAGTQRLLDGDTSIERVVVVGITGAIDDTTAIGTVVRPAAVVNSHTGAEFRPSPLGGGAPCGIMWTTDVLLSGADTYDDLRARGVVCLDMETAAIAEACEAHGVPWSVFRAISDGPADEVDEEVFKLSNQDGTPNLGNVARYVLKHPGRIPGMARMGRNLKIATDAATAAALAACRAPTET